MDTSNQTTTPTVLLIDDERMNRLIVGDYLRDSGYAVLEAESSSEGLRIFDNARPDIVITDLRMPGGDGNQVVTRLQNIAPDTPVIIISGTASLEEACARCATAPAISSPNRCGKWAASSTPSKRP